MTGCDTSTIFVPRKGDNENIVSVWNTGISEDSHENFIEKKTVTERKKERKKIMCSKQGPIKVKFSEAPF